MNMSHIPARLTLIATLSLLVPHGVAHSQDNASPPGGGVVAAAPNGPDITFCDLHELFQFGRVGDTVGFAATTTSWNVGSEDATWLAVPNNLHPFIAQNIYRLKNDRFEHIGQSWVKHAYFALDSEQCGTQCTYEAGHGQGNWLGVGCTDTYGASLNADQSDLGPRSEINPWTGAYTYPGSHLAASHGHGGNGIAHRLQVQDGDLNPALNAGATYFLEGYYVHFEDIDPMNSAAWKQISLISGMPGGTWNFNSGGTTDHTIGFAIDAWPGAQKTVIAQSVPPIKFASQDGRSILAVKTTALGGDNHHFEYALLNVDMNRQVGSFSIPVPAGVTVSNPGFHAVRSHGESFDNVPWTAVINSNSITWSTTNNPLRWGTLYNFWFDADAPPGDSVATLGLHTPGSPTSLTGITRGPFSTIPAASSWTLVAFTLLLLTFGTIVARRRTLFAP